MRQHRRHVHQGVPQCRPPLGATRPDWRHAVAGALVGGAALAVGEFVAAQAPESRSPVAGLGRALIDTTPGPVVDVAVALVGEVDKPLLAAGVGSGIGILCAAAGVVAPSRPRAALLLAVGPPLLGTGYGLRLPGGNRLGTAVASLTTGATAHALQAALRRFPRRPPLARLLLLTATVTVGATARRRERCLRDEQARARLTMPSTVQTLPDTPASADPNIPGLASLLTPSGDFYKIDVTFPAPRVDVTSWRLRVHGAVGTALELTMADLFGLEVAEVDALLVCVHNPIGGGRMGNGRWTAIPLAALLHRAGLPPDLVADPARGELVAHSIDGFTAALPLGIALDRALVAVGLDGQPLPTRNGFPARLLVPGRFGYAANVKWLAALEVRDHGTDRAGQPVRVGYWTTRGWPVHGGRIESSSRIDVPRPWVNVIAGSVVVAGYAWAPPGGIRGVEVAVDDGPWQPAELATSLSPLSWRAWTYQWMATPGRHTLTVRCHGVDGCQKERDAAPYPEGPSGLHTVPVQVIEATSVRRRARARLRVVQHGAAARLRLAVGSGRAWRQRTSKSLLRPLG